MRCRFYHADPHAGNILRMTDGRLCYLDFGMMGRIDRATRQALIRATLHMVNREFDALATDFVTLGLLPEDTPASREEIIAALQGAQHAYIFCSATTRLFLLVQLDCTALIFPSVLVFWLIVGSELFVDAVHHEWHSAT